MACHGQDSRVEFQLKPLLSVGTDFGLTLLVMPEAERRWPRQDEVEEPVGR